MIHGMETKQLDWFPLPIGSPWRIKLDTIIQIEKFINDLAVLGLPHSLTDSLTHCVGFKAFSLPDQTKTPT